MIPIKGLLLLIKGVVSTVTYVSNAIKNSFIGKLLGWDKEDNESDKMVLSKKRQDQCQMHG